MGIWLDIEVGGPRKSKGQKTFNGELRSRKLSQLIHTLMKTDHEGYKDLDISGVGLGLDSRHISKFYLIIKLRGIVFFVQPNI